MGRLRAGPYTVRPQPPHEQVPQLDSVRGEGVVVVVINDRDALAARRANGAREPLMHRRIFVRRVVRRGNKEQWMLGESARQREVIPLRVCGHFVREIDGGGMYRPTGGGGV